MIEPTFTLLQGDCRRTGLPDRSVHCVVTSPPYWGLRDYGTGRWSGGDPACAHVPESGPAFKSPHPPAPDNAQDGEPAGCARCGAAYRDHQLGQEPLLDCLAWARGEPPCGGCYVCSLRRVFAELRRVLRDDGTCWLNLGDCYATDYKCGRQKSGPNRWSVAGGYGRGVRRQRPGLRRKNLCLAPHRAALALQADGWCVRTDICWAKGNPMPESVRDRPTRSHEYVFLLAKSRHYYYDAAAIAEPVAASSRQRYAQPALESQRGGRKQELYRQGVPGQKSRGRSPAAITRHLAQVGQERRNARTVWKINTVPSRREHFAAFPLELPRRCILAGSGAAGCCPRCGAPWRRRKEPHGRSGTQDAKPDNVRPGRDELPAGWQPSCVCPPAPPTPCTVFDPFAGSGTTGAAALGCGRRFIGMDLNGRYLDMAKQRLEEIRAAS
jgi:site-specific DNA-methyltransferase (cytosine-N4-specific)